MGSNAAKHCCIKRANATDGVTVFETHHGCLLRPAGLLETRMHFTRDRSDWIEVSDGSVRIKPTGTAQKRRPRRLSVLSFAGGKYCPGPQRRWEIGRLRVRRYRERGFDSSTEVGRLRRARPIAIAFCTAFRKETRCCTSIRSFFIRYFERRRDPGSVRGANS
jgi:hypothetical protein